MTIERIVKEKNIISIYPEGKTRCYTIDINTGCVCGLLGKEIQRVQITRSAIYAYYLKHDINANKSYFYKTLSQLFDNWCSTTQTATIKDNIKALQVADSLTNANVHIISDAMDICRLMFIADNLKEYVAYAKRVEAGEQISVVDWIKELKYHKFLKEHNLNANIVSYDSYIELQSYPRILQNMLHYQYILNHKDSVTNLCRFGYMVCHNSEARNVEYYVYRTINKYYEWCECLKKKPEKAVNMGREIMETYQTYMLNKEKFDTEKMINNYAKHSKAFEFTYGNYTVVIPKTPKDIIDEGINMHHCVGGYVQQVVNNDCYIIFVRHKDTPDKCYITAEIYTDGNMGQYFLAYDRRITKDEDKEFYTALRNHIKANW